MNNSPRLLFFIGLVCLQGCGAPGEEAGPGPVFDALETRAVFQRMLAQYGSIATWRQYGTLEFELQRAFMGIPGAERQVVDLHRRHTHISSPSYTLGFDGAQTWITPDAEALGYPATPGLYAGLYFYFFSMPFVWMDPGVRVATLEPITLEGVRYHRLEVTYGAGVGATPKDTYIVHLDPETYEMRFVRYSVTYFTGVPATPNTVVVFEDWQEVEGLRVPRQIAHYRWEAARMIHKMGEVRFSEVVFETQQPPPAFFARPDGAVVDTLFAADGGLTR